MRIVELHGNLVGQLLPLATRLGGQKVGDHVLQRRRHEEVLLLETQLLACVVVIIRVEHLRDLEGALAGSQRCSILAFVELAKVKFCVGHCRPQAQRVGVQRVVPRDGNVIRNSHDHLGTKERDGILDIKALDLPGVALGQPSVGVLNLIAILKALFEHAC